VKLSKYLFDCTVNTVRSHTLLAQLGLQINWQKTKLQTTTEDRCRSWSQLRYRQGNGHDDDDDDDDAVKSGCL